MSPVRWLADGIYRGADPLSGAIVWQLTSMPAINHNIYGERVFACTDGTRIAFVRDLAYGEDQLELWVYDLPTRRELKIGDALGWFTTTPFLDTLYYLRKVGETPHLMRLHLKTLELSDVFALDQCPLWTSAAAISPDERYFVFCLRIQGNRYRLIRVDLTSGTWDIFHEHEDIFNTHVQFEPLKGEDILVQWNREGILDDADNVVRSVGEQGATCYVIDREGGNFRQLPVGKPFTAPVTGHECWVGTTGQVILTTKDGGVYLCAPGDQQARLVVRKRGFNHISASPDGRFFVVDDFRNGVLYVGSIATGHCFPLCSSRANSGAPQHTHTHPYITPGNRYVIYNSDATGVTQVYAAEIPSGFLEDLESPR
ncbi:MAG: hypothetical protein ACUVR7_08410 [Armatimonadota bacterium]